MKRILLLIGLFVSLCSSVYSLSDTEIDGYWLLFIRNSEEIGLVLKTVKSSGDMDLAGDKIRNLYKQFVQKTISLYGQLDTQQLKNRLSWHFKNKTPLASLMLQRTRVAGVEMRRIMQLSGGKEFIASVFGNRQAAEDIQRQLRERGYQTQ